MSLFEQIRLLHPGWRDILEVALVSFAIYRVLLLVHRTRAIYSLNYYEVAALHEARKAASIDAPTTVAKASQD